MPHAQKKYVKYIGYLKLPSTGKNEKREAAKK